MSRAETLSKGQQTAHRIMDAAQELFATHGFEGTSLRQVAQGAGIREPGIYNHFDGKRGLYGAVLERALAPMLDALAAPPPGRDPLRNYAELPSTMIDLLVAHPHMAALFQQALQADAEAPARQLMGPWLQQLFREGAARMAAALGDTETDQAELALRVIAMFNLTTGYFLAAGPYAELGGGDILSADNIARHKRLLRRVAATLMLD